MAENLGFLSGFEPSTLVNGENWLFNSVLAALVVIIAHTIVIMFSRAFKWDELERYAKSEILQGLATALIAIFAVSMVLSVEGYLSQQFLGAQVQCLDAPGGKISIVDPYAKDQTVSQTMLYAVKCKLRDKALSLGNLYDSVYSNAESVFSDLSTYISLLGFPVWQGSWDSEKFNEGENIRILNQLITNLLIGLNGMIVLVNYISKNMLTVYLPAGILLRTFHFTRGIGAFFIAAAIGFYFVFPTLFILTDPTLEKLPTIPIAQSLKQIPSCYPTFSGVASTFTISSVIKSSISISTKEAARIISQFYISMIIHPFAVFAVTLMFIRYTMTLLSGEPYEIMRFVARMV